MQQPHTGLMWRNGKQSRIEVRIRIFLKEYPYTAYIQQDCPRSGWSALIFPETVPQETIHRLDEWVNSSAHFLPQFPDLPRQCMSYTLTARIPIKCYAAFLAFVMNAVEPGYHCTTDSSLAKMYHDVVVKGIYLDGLKRLARSPHVATWTIMDDAGVSYDQIEVPERVG